MSRLSKLKKYSDVPSQILRDYKNGPGHFIANEEDKDLTSIQVNLPKYPDWREVDGYGEKARDQKWRVPVMPDRLKDLIARVSEDEDASANDIWEELENKQYYYKEEIKWIKTQVYRVFNGYYFFNNGEVTYMDGWHYAYCAFWENQDGLPKYRQRDWKFFHFARMCYNDPFCYGFNYPKHRREGATSKAACIHYFIIIFLRRALGGVQSKNEDDAEKVFQKHIVPAWRSSKMPFFFKPEHRGNNNPARRLDFSSEGKKVGATGAKLSTDRALSSEISFRSALPGAYDGDKLFFYHQDECGKAIGIDIIERWRIVRKCLAQGNGRIIHGFSIHTSTVGKMEKGGGEQFLRHCVNSDYSTRNKNNQTTTGLYTLFIPATEGLDGFIDEYGNSVVETPKKPVMGVNGVMISIGSREYIQNEREDYEQKEDGEGLSEAIRQTPLSFLECFRGSAKDSGFNLNKLDDCIPKLRIMKDRVRLGYFEENPETKKVEWVDDDFNPRFELSIDLPFAQTNSEHWSHEGMYWMPQNHDRFVAGADPFKFNKTQGRRMSNGGGAVFFKRDKHLDPDGKDINEWESHRYVCTYSYRPKTKPEYCKDMLLMCRYFSCKMFPEMDVPIVADYFEEKGYGGFLQYKIEVDGEPRQNPGDMSNTKTKQEIFTWYMDYIENHCHRERHLGILEECREIGGPDQMTDYDLFTAGGYAGIASKPLYDEIEQRKRAEFDISDYLETYEV